MQNCRYHHQGSYVFAGVHRSACWAAGLRKTEWISMILGYRMGLDQEKTPSNFGVHMDKRKDLGKGYKVS